MKSFVPPSPYPRERTLVKAWSAWQLLFPRLAEPPEAPGVGAVIVQPLSSVWLFAIPWTIAPQASLSFTISRSRSGTHLNVNSSPTPLPMSGSSFTVSASSAGMTENMTQLTLLIAISCPGKLSSTAKVICIFQGPTGSRVPPCWFNRRTYYFFSEESWAA